MANRRMINKSISTSEQVNSLPLECQLLFTWMITHADDDGRMKGSAITVRGLVFPLKEFSVQEVEEMLQKLQEVGLIWRWSSDNTTYIEFPTWKKHQQIRSDRYHESELPSYESYANQKDTNGIQDDNHDDTQYKVVEDNAVQGNEEKNILREWESEGEPTPSFSYTPKSLSEHAALRAWNTFDKEHPELLESRYLPPARSGVKTTVLQTITNDLIKDHTITDKGKEFEKRVKQFMEKNSIEQTK